MILYQQVVSDVAFREQRPTHIASGYFLFVLMTLKPYMSTYLNEVSAKIFGSKSHRFFFAPGPAFRTGWASEESDGNESSDVTSGS